MQYINPIDILELSNVAEASNIDNEVIKKAKRKLFADIDLSDNGVYEYYGLQLTKGDCERAIELLSNNDLKEYFLYLSSNKKLNEFLINGNDEVFESFKQDSIFKLPDFVNFISPYFAPKFDKALLQAFENEDLQQTKAILKTSFLIAQKDINTAYRSISIAIQNRIAEINEIKNDIKNEISDFDDDSIENAVDLVTENFPSDILNVLPNYFQSQILNVAKAINYLQLAIWDNFDNTQVPNDLLEHVLSLNISGLDKPTFENNYKIVNKKHRERFEQERNAPTLRKYAGYFIQAKTKLNEIKNKTTTPQSVLSWANTAFQTSEINGLPSVFNEIRNQIALALRALSVEVWNSFSNIDVAISLIDKANNITGLTAETSRNIQDAKQQLSALKAKINLANQRTVSRTPTYSTSNSNSNSGSNRTILYLVIGVVILIAIAKIKSCNSDYTPKSTYNYKEPTTTYDNNSNSNSHSPPSTNYDYTPPVESKYKGNQLKDGTSPLDGCFGKGVYNGNATLTIKNGGSSDAIVCLYSIARGKTIRNEYVRRNSSFTMSNIAQGSYKIRVFYGNDWNPNLTNSCGTKGNFETDVNFSEFDGTEYFEDSDRGYTIATITLYTVAGGNASSSAIDQSTFFNN